MHDLFLFKVSIFFLEALSGLFSQILSGDDLIREKAVKFMAVKLKNIPEDTWTAELETYFVDETRKVCISYAIRVGVLCSCCFA